MPTVDLAPVNAYATGTVGHWDFVGSGATAMSDASDATYARLETGADFSVGWQTAMFVELPPIDVASINSLTINMRAGDTSVTGFAANALIGFGFFFYADETFDDLLFYLVQPSSTPQFPVPIPQAGFADYSWTPEGMLDGTTGLHVPGSVPALLAHFAAGAKILVNFSGSSTGLPWNDICYVSEFSLTVDYTPKGGSSSPRRTYPRDDGRRVFPPSKAQQSGNRTFGGYL